MTRLPLAIYGWAWYFEKRGHLSFISAWMLLGMLPLSGSASLMSSQLSIHIKSKNIISDIYITTYTRGALDYGTVRRGIINGEGTKAAKGPDRGFTISNRVLYQELKEGSVCL